MAITTSTSIDEITISENFSVLIRQNTTVSDGNTIIGNTYQRTTLMPGQDISNQPNNIVALCNSIWTAEVIEAYKAKIASNATVNQNTSTIGA